MIHQLRIYEIYEHNKAAFHARFRDHAARLMRGYGFVIVAIWESRSDERTEFVYLLAWPYEATMRQAWAAFLADAEWVEIKRVTREQHGDLVGAIADRMLHPLGDTSGIGILPPAPDTSGALPGHPRRLAGHPLGPEDPAGDRRAPRAQRLAQPPLAAQSEATAAPTTPGAAQLRPSPGRERHAGRKERPDLRRDRRHRQRGGPHLRPRWCPRVYLRAQRGGPGEAG